MQIIGMYNGKIVLLYISCVKFFKKDFWQLRLSILIFY